MTTMREELEVDRTNDGILLVDIKQRAFDLKVLGGGQVKLGNVYEMLAAAYGYGTYAAMRASAVDGYVPRKESQNK